MLILAVGLALLAAMWFARFDDSRKDRAVADATSDPTDAPKAAPSAKAAGATSGASARAAPPTFAGSTLPAVRAARGNAFGGLVAGELRILLRGVPGWWMLGAGALIVAALLVPESSRCCRSLGAGPL